MDVAAGQHGVVTRAQLEQAGISRHVVDRHVRMRYCRPVHAGVYQVGPVVAPLAREMAAVLACRLAAVSHWSAAHLHKLGPARTADEPVHVTIPCARLVRRAGIRTHRSDLPESEVTRIDGIPVTSLARTLLDLSTVASARELERAMAIAERTRGGLDEVRSFLDRRGTRGRARRLHDLLDRETVPALARSEAEERLLALIRKGGLTEPEMNVVLHGHEVDCYWRRARLVVEVDGYAYHASKAAFVRDRQRDSALAAAGIQVLRLSWQQVAHEREKTLVQLAQALVRAQP